MVEQQSIHDGRRHFMHGLVFLVILAALLGRWDPADSPPPPARAGADTGDELEVLATLPLANRDPQLRRAARQSPAQDDAPGVVSLAAGYIEQLRREGDSRLGGFAETLLLRESAKTEPNARLLLADLYQFQHRFDESEAILAELRATGAGGSRTWLLSANLARIQGRLADAAAACDEAGRAGARFWARLCLADLALLNGDLPAYRENLTQISAADNRYWQRDPVAAIWQGDMADRAGDTRAAERHFRTALMLGPGPYLVDRYFRFLVEDKRIDAAERLVTWWAAQSGEPGLSGLLNQAELAAVRANRSGLASLSRQFNDLSRSMRGSAHGREMARYELIVTQNFPKALEHARQNWAMQKEPVDAILLARAARLADSEASLQALEKELIARGMNGVLRDLNARELL